MIILGKLTVDSLSSSKSRTEVALVGLIEVCLLLTIRNESIQKLSHFKFKAVSLPTHSSKSISYQGVFCDFPSVFFWKCQIEWNAVLINSNLSIDFPPLCSIRKRFPTNGIRSSHWLMVNDPISWILTELPHNPSNGRAPFSPEGQQGWVLFPEA